jgi:hypothetical protein
MTGLVKFAGANLPAVQSLSTALRVAAESVAPPGSTVILKMDKTGHWVFGADLTEVRPDSRWAINPFSFLHGFIAWGGEHTPMRGQVLGERLVSMTDPLPEVGASPEHATKGWEMQVGFCLKCVSGEDKDMEAKFTATSLGGRRAVQELALKIAEQVEKDSSKPVPVLTLGKDHYQHKAYGRVYVPVFHVVDWVSMTGEDAADADAEPEVEAAEDAEQPRRRRRVAA